MINEGFRDAVIDVTIREIVMKRIRAQPQGVSGKSQSLTGFSL